MSIKSASSFLSFTLTVVSIAPATVYTLVALVIVLLTPYVPYIFGNCMHRVHLASIRVANLSVFFV